MINIKINNREYSYEEPTTILDAAKYQLFVIMKNWLLMEVVDYVLLR
jgi:hypothetical protein